MDAIPDWRPAAHSAFRSVCERLGQARVGELCGKTQGAVSKRLSAGHPIWGDIGLEAFVAIETESNVSRHDLRPDIYPREDSPPAPPAASGVGTAGGSSALEGVRS